MKRVTPAALLFLSAGAVVAAPAANSPLAKMGVGSNGNGTLSMPMEIAISLTLLTLLPAALMCITPFLRITVVLHFLRQALGTQSTPSNQVLIGLALFPKLLSALFNTEAGGHQLVRGVSVPVDEEIGGFALTLEPAGGSPQPTSTPIVFGTAGGS